MGIPANHPAIVEAYRKGLVTEHRRPLGRHATPERNVAELEAVIQRRERVAFTKFVEVRTVSRTNGPRFSKASIGRPAKEREATHAAFADVLPSTWERLAAGCTVHLVRCSPGKLDGDNLQGALKSVRDAIGQLLHGGRPGQHDDDERVTWEYGQFQCRAHGVLVTVEENA